MVFGTAGAAAGAVTRSKPPEWLCAPVVDLVGRGGHRVLAQHPFAAVSCDIPPDSPTTLKT